MSETYHGTRRGRSSAGEFSAELFPEKYEFTEMVEDPDMIRDDRRTTISDWSPEQNTLLASEEARRRTYGMQRLNLMQNGTPGPGTLPYISHGDFEISFTDQDPRGTDNQPDYKEYRRQQEANFRRIDYKDDSDFSTPEIGISPFTMYRNIKSAFNWVKARKKIFETSYESRSNGGVGVYDHVSNVFKSDNEDTNVITDGDSGIATTFEDPENRQHHTTKLSNIVHMGSAFLRANTTSDHRVKVSALGKLYSNQGLLPHETQLRLIEDDTPISRLDSMRATPKNLAQLMSNYVHQTDYSEGNYGDYAARTGSKPASSIQGQRAMWQDSVGDKEKFSGMRGDSEATENRAIGLTKDILSLMGLTATEVKWAQSHERENAQQAQPILANMHKLAELVHRMPAHLKIEVKNELILRSAGAGGGLRTPTPGQLRMTRDSVVVNPKIRQHMELSVRGQADPADVRVVMDAVDADPTGHRRPMGTPLMSYKTQSRDSEEVGANRRQTDAAQRGRGHQQDRADKPAYQYTQLAILARETENNRQRGNQPDQIVEDPANVEARGGIRPNTQDDFYKAMMSSVLDVEFPENRALSRHAAAPKVKSTARRYVDTDYRTYDGTREIGPSLNKNPSNAGPLRR
jgi:hypothetical protein